MAGKSCVPYSFWPVRLSVWDKCMEVILVKERLAQGQVNGAR